MVAGVSTGCDNEQAISKTDNLVGVSPTVRGYSFGLKSFNEVRISVCKREIR